MKIIIILFFFIGSPVILFAQEITDIQAFVIVKDLFFNLQTSPFGWGSGILILSSIMSLMKWKRFGLVFYKIPKQYRSIIPITIGGLIGIAQILSGGVIAPMLLLKAFINGAITVGGGQQVFYQQLKGTWIGEILSILIGEKSKISNSEK